MSRPGQKLGSYVKKGEALKASKREAAPKMSLAAGNCRRSQADDLVDRAQVQAW